MQEFLYLFQLFACLLFHIIHQACGETVVGLLGARGLRSVQVQGLRHLEGGLHILVQPQLDLGGCLQVGCPRNEQKEFRFEPKQDLFRLCFCLFCEAENKKIQFVSVFRTFIKTTETNRTVSKQTETTLNFLKNTQICSLSNCFGWSPVCFGSIDTSKFCETAETSVLFPIGQELVSVPVSVVSNRN